MAFGAEVYRVPKDRQRLDKDSIKRSQIHHVCAKDVEAMYEKLEHNETGSSKLDIRAMEEWIMKTFRETLKVQISSPQDDVFTAGINNLQGIHVRPFRSLSFLVSVLGPKPFLGRRKLS